MIKINLTCATLIPVQKLMFPHGCTACSFDSILPVSGVSVVSTSQLLQSESQHLCYHRFNPILNLSILKWIAAYFAMEMRPTLFSGLLRVFEWHTMLTASCWACSRVGRKSPFRMYSLLSTLRKFIVDYLKYKHLFSVNECYKSNNINIACEKRPKTNIIRIFPTQNWHLKVDYANKRI